MVGSNQVQFSFLLCTFIPIPFSSTCHPPINSSLTYQRFTLSILTLGIVISLLSLNSHDTMTTQIGCVMTRDKNYYITFKKKSLRNLNGYGTFAWTALSVKPQSGHRPGKVRSSIQIHNSLIVQSTMIHIHFIEGPTTTNSFTFNLTL